MDGNEYDMQRQDEPEQEFKGVEEAFQADSKKISKRKRNSDGENFLDKVDRIFEEDKLDGIPIPTDELYNFIHKAAQHICITRSKRNAMFRSLNPSSLIAMGIILQTHTYSILESLLDDSSEEGRGNGDEPTDGVNDDGNDGTTEEEGNATHAREPEQVSFSSVAEGVISTDETSGGGEMDNEKAT